MAARIFIWTFLAAAVSTPAIAQSYSPWDDEPFWERPQRRYQNYDPWRFRDRGYQYPDEFERRFQQQTPQSTVFDGGGRPYIQPEEPPVVAFPYEFPSQSIVIDNSGKKLYFVLDGQEAYVYPISIGREGFSWTGTEKISRKQEWPDWHPPAEMRKRDPKLPEKMTGGVKNPLGALALYLGNTLYRIHGTNDPKTIGRAASSGCFRMMNAHVLHLSMMAEIGTAVTVVMSLPRAREPQVAETRPQPPRIAPQVAESRVRPRVAPRWYDPYAGDDETYERIDGRYRRVDPYQEPDPYYDEPVDSYRNAPRYDRNPYER